MTDTRVRSNAGFSASCRGIRLFYSALQSPPTPLSSPRLFIAVSCNSLFVRRDSYRCSTIKVTLIAADVTSIFEKKKNRTRPPRNFSAQQKNRRYRSQFNKANNNSHNDAINAHGRCKNALTVYRGEKPLRAVCDKKKGTRVRQSPTQRQPRLWRLNYTLLFFCSARRRASAIIRLVGTFDLGSSNSRYVSGTQRNAKHRGVVVRQSGRPASHAYGAFHYIKPFQCIIYFCVSHLRYGLCTGDGGQRALSATSPT